MVKRLYIGDLHVLVEMNWSRRPGDPNEITAKLGRSPWGVQVKQLTGYVGTSLLPHLAQTSGKVSLNLALDLVTSCYGPKAVCWRPA